MEFTVKNDELVKALNIVKGTFGSKHIPALNNIYFEADVNGTVTVKSSNGDETTTTRFMARVQQDGKALIDGFTISRVAATFADGDVTIRRVPNTFHVEAIHPTGELEIEGTDPDFFVHPQEVTEQSSFVIPSKEFKQALEKVAFARANNHSNNKLNGIAIIIDNGKTHLFATDLTRVAKYVFDTPAADDINVVLVPETIKALSSVTGNIAVRLSDSAVLLETNDTSYQGVVMAQQFPPAVNNYFLAPEHASLTAQKEALKDILTRVSIVSKAGKDDPYADFHFKSSGELEIQFKGTRGKVKTEKLPTKHNGPDVYLRLSVDKILETLKIIDKDDVEIVFPKGKQGVVSLIIYPEGSRDYGVFNMSIQTGA